MQPFDNFTDALFLHSFCSERRKQEEEERRRREEEEVTVQYLKKLSISCNHEFSLDQQSDDRRRAAVLIRLFNV